MMRQRVITALWGVPILFVIVWFGGVWVFTLLIAIVASLGALEFYRMVAHSRGQPFTYFGLIWALLFVLSPHLDNPWTQPLLAITAAVFPLIWLLFHPRREKIFSNWGWTLGGIFYTGWMLSCLVTLRGLEGGKEWVLFALFSTFACDTTAFFVGRARGRHLLAPVISPGKTWEGAIAGFLAASVASVILAVPLGLPIDYGQAIILGCLIGIFAQLGDLAESLLKRRAEVKDSGKLIPGHGGILDRFDSIVFTGVVVYYYVVYIVG